MRIIATVALFLLMFSLSAQSTGALLPAGSVGVLQSSWLHLDKPFYVTEDPLGFQLYLAPEFAARKTVVQSILFDATGTAVLYAYWTPEEGAAVPGKLMIPRELPTGWYYLSFRAWDEERGTEKVLLQAPVAIYNDLVPITPERVSRSEPARQTAAVAMPEKELSVEITDLPERGEGGTTIYPTIKVLDRRGRPVAASVSVSVSDWGLLGVSGAMGMDNLHGTDSLRVITPEHLSERLYWRGLVNAGSADSEPLHLKIGKREEVIRPDDQGGILWISEDRAGELPPVSVWNAEGRPANVRFRPAPGRLALGELSYSPAAFRYLEINRQRKAVTQSDADASEPERYQNPAGPLPETGFVGPAAGRELVWKYQNPLRPAAPTLLWQTAVTDENGTLTLEYRHPSEATIYRVDIIAQDARGRRGRKTVYYSVE